MLVQIVILKQWTDLLPLNELLKLEWIDIGKLGL